MIVLFSMFLMLAFFKGAWCDSDKSCISEKMSNLSISAFFEDPSELCYDIELKFNIAEKGLKECTGHKINIDKYENLVKDFCNHHSSFGRTFMKNKDCILTHLKDVLVCLKNYLDYKQISKDSRNINETAIEEKCDSSIEVLANCVYNKIYEPCGDSAANIYKRVLDSVKSFMIQECFIIVSNEIADAGHIPFDIDREIRGYTKIQISNGCSTVLKLIPWYIVFIFFMLLMYV